MRVGSFPGNVPGHIDGIVELVALPVALLGMIRSFAAFLDSIICQ